MRERMRRLFSGWSSDRLLDGTARLEENEELRAAVFLLVLVLIGACLFLLNCHTPVMVDDFDYRFSYSTGELIGSIQDVFVSQAAHYMIWGGRLMHCFTQSFLYFGKPVFNIANTVMYLLLLLEIYAIARPKRRFCWTMLLAEHMALFTMLPFFGSAFLWLTGACMYLWGTVLALMPLVIIRSVHDGEWIAQGSLRAVLCLPVGIVAGWTNENTTLGMIALVFAWIALEALKGKKIKKRLIVLLIGQCIGALLLLLAPGNFARASVYTYDSMLLEMIRRAVVILAYTVVYLGMLLAACVIGSALLKGYNHRGEAVWLLIVGALVSAFAMIGSPELSDRTYTGSFALMLAAAMTLLGQAEEHIRKADGAKLLVLPLLLLVCMHGGYKAVREVQVHEAAWNTQISRIEIAKAQGLERVELESVPSVSPYTFSILIGEDPDVWPNSTLSKYFGIEIAGKQSGAE